MADKLPNLANPTVNSPPLTATSSQPIFPFTPRSSSIADDSDAEFEPTPIHSPGGPQYNDLPPSYDEARQQAVHDAHNGVVPLNPNEIEAHRLTLNEGPNEPEIWEYRVRGEQPGAVDKHEQAPGYASHFSNLAATVPVQHVSTSDNIPVGRVQARNQPSIALPDLTPRLLSTALEFTRHEPDVDAQYASKLVRPVAIPQEGLSGLRHGSDNRKAHDSHHKRRLRYEQQVPHNTVGLSDGLIGVSTESVQFTRAYAKALHANSIRPAEFMEFLDGLNALCEATGTTAEALSSETASLDSPSSIVHDYIRGTNESFFAPRGLRVSLHSFSALFQTLQIPTERGQRAGAMASVLDRASASYKRAQALHPWIEALESNVPAASTNTLLLREMIARLGSPAHVHCSASSGTADGLPSERTGQFTSAEECVDPPHSIPEVADDAYENHGRWGGGSPGSRGRGRYHGGPWTPFGPPRHGPFGIPGGGPFGRPDRGPFGPLGNRPFVNPPSSGPGGPPPFNRGPSRLDPIQQKNEWAAWGENIGKMGEEFGRRMGDWNQQFEKRAEAWGQDVGRRAEVWGEGVSGAGGSGTQRRSQPGSSSTQSHHDLPPSYVEDFAGQDSDVVREKSSVHPASAKSVNEKKMCSKSKDDEGDDDDDDASSISSSSSSSSDSDSDSDSDNFPNTEVIFLKRIRSINEQADLSLRKGKKNSEEVAQKRARAIEKAQDEKTTMDLKIEGKMSKRMARRELKQKSRELKRQHRQKKREFRAGHDRKGKGKAKKTKEWREAKRAYREQKKELRRQKMNARKEWREARYDRKKLTRERGVGSAGCQEDGMDGIVWVVIQNWGP